MSNLELYTRGDTKLVVAFDIGTTFSGISYCVFEPGEPKPDVFDVTRFPGQPQVRGDAKVPSLLYYDKHGNFKVAGTEVLNESVVEIALTDGWIKAEWWKLHLRPKHLASTINKDILPPLPPGKDAVDVLTDFIKFLFQCAKTHIQTHHPALPWSSVKDSIEFIFTYPNNWESTQQLYRRAIEAAGLVPSASEGSRVYMLSEGEASLHYCAGDLLKAEKTKQTPQGVVVVDAGGGTIDVSMFSMATKPISCREIVPAECRLQGSVLVTLRAMRLLETKLKDWERCKPDDIAEFTREFDQTTKLDIKSARKSAYIRVAGRRINNPQYNILNGKLMLTGEEATNLFQKSIKAITDAFEQQQRKLKSDMTPITRAFFVGGLSTNEWVWSQIQSYFDGKGIEIHRPDNHICKPAAHGAVLSYVDDKNHSTTPVTTPVVTPATIPVVTPEACATFGIVCANPTREKRESNQEDPAGGWYVQNYFHAIITKGEKVDEGKEFHGPFSRTEAKPADFGEQIIELVYYRGELPKPVSVDEDPCAASFSTFCFIHVDLREAAKDLVPATDQVYYRLDYDVIMTFGQTGFKAQLAWRVKDGRECRMQARVQFPEE